MIRLAFIFFLSTFAASVALSQTFTPNDLVSLSSFTPKYAEQFLTKKGFMPRSGATDYTTRMISFTETIAKENIENSSNGLFTQSRIDIFSKEGYKYFVWHTTSEKEFLEGKKELARIGFFYDRSISMEKDTSLLFQRKNITVETRRETADSIQRFSFILKKKEFPDPASVQHGEDLLNFTSNEQLIGFFGKDNVKTDLYYYSESELRDCSIIFPNSNRQAVFVWNDQKNLQDLSYIIISDVMPTVSGQQFKGVILNNNQWELKNGIRCGLDIKELVKLNKNDFEIYGKNSEFAFIIKPVKEGAIDFSKTGIALNCFNCTNRKLFDASIVNATNVVNENLLVSVKSIFIFPEK